MLDPCIKVMIYDVFSSNEKYISSIKRERERDTHIEAHKILNIMRAIDIGILPISPF